jgi:hypothetical protein
MRSFSPDEGAASLTSAVAVQQAQARRDVIALRQVAGLGDVGVARLLALHGDATRALASVGLVRTALRSSIDSRVSAHPR